MTANVTECTSDAILEVGKVWRQPAISEKQKSEPSKVRKKDRTDTRAGYKSEKSRPKGKKEVRRAGKSKRIKKTEVPVFSFIKLLILYLHLHLHSLYLATLFTYTHFNYKLDLDTHNTIFHCITYILAIYLFSSF